MNETTQKLMFSSAKEEWSTPQKFYSELDKEFGGFQLDPASTEENHKCPRYFTKESNGLAQDWAPFRTFCNPPYGRKTTGLWVKKAYDEWQKGALVVMLLPSRTDTLWFHKWVNRKAEVRFVKGRLKFGGAVHGAPFPSLVAIFHPGILWGTVEALRQIHTVQIDKMTAKQVEEFVKQCENSPILPIQNCRHCGGEL